MRPKDTPDELEKARIRAARRRRENPGCNAKYSREWKRRNNYKIQAANIKHLNEHPEESMFPRCVSLDSPKFNHTGQQIRPTMLLDKIAADTLSPDKMVMLKEEYDSQNPR